MDGSSQALKEYTEKRTIKLEKYVHNNTTCHMVFFKEKNDCVAQAHVVSGDIEARGESREETFYASVDTLMDKIIQQLRKQKEKDTKHTGKAHHNVE